VRTVLRHGCPGLTPEGRSRGGPCFLGLGTRLFYRGGNLALFLSFSRNAARRRNVRVEPVARLIYRLPQPEPIVARFSAGDRPDVASRAVEFHARLTIWTALRTEWRWGAGISRTPQDTFRCLCCGEPLV
jgi:hypothetical protein